MRPTEFTVSLRRGNDGLGYLGIRFWERRNLPDSDEFNVNVHRKSAFESGRLLPSDVVGACKHFVGERNLLKVA